MSKSSIANLQASKIIASSSFAIARLAIAFTFCITLIGFLFAGAANATEAQTELAFGIEDRQIGDHPKTNFENGSTVTSLSIKHYFQSLSSDVSPFDYKNFLSPSSSIALTATQEERDTDKIVRYQSFQAAYHHLAANNLILSGTISQQESEQLNKVSLFTAGIARYFKESTLVSFGLASGKNKDEESFELDINRPSEFDINKASVKIENLHSLGLGKFLLLSAEYEQEELRKSANSEQNNTLEINGAFYLSTKQKVFLNALRYDDADSEESFKRYGLGGAYLFRKDLSAEISASQQSGKESSYFDEDNIKLQLNYWF